MLDLFKKIKVFVFDLDGVLTDGTVYVISGDQQMRRMNIKDGYALQMAVKKNYRLLVISGGSSEAVKERLARLGINEVYMAVEDKKTMLAEYLEKNKLGWNEVLYMGDDIPDLELINMVGLSTCPVDAVPEIRAAVKYISPMEGGKGCVRDVIEKVLRLNGHWFHEMNIASK